MRLWIIFTALVTGLTITPNVNLDTSLSNLQKWYNEHRSLYIVDTIEELDASKILKHGIVKIRNTNEVIVPGDNQDEITSYWGPTKSESSFNFVMFDLSKSNHEESVYTRDFGKSLDNTKSSVDNSISYGVGASWDRTLSFVSTLARNNIELNTEFDFTKGSGINQDISCTVPAGKTGRMQVTIRTFNYKNIKLTPLIIHYKKSIRGTKTQSMEFGEPYFTDYEVPKSFRPSCYSE